MIEMRMSFERGLTLELKQDEHHVEFPACRAEARRAEGRPVSPKPVGRRADALMSYTKVGRSSSCTLRPTRATISGTASTSARVVWKLTMHARST